MAIRYDRLEYQPYFRALADRLSLRDWQIEVLDESPSDPSALLSVDPVEGRKWARVRISEDFLRDRETSQRHSATHELIHVHHSAELFLSRKHLSTEAYAAWLLVHEYAVDGLADGIADLLPLPSEVLNDGR